MKTKSVFAGRRAGVSLVEVILIVGVLGVLAALAVPVWSDTFGQGRRVVANEVLETVNLALKQHEQVNYRFNLAADNDSGDDELAIIRSLQ